MEIIANNLEIQEKDLELVISKKELGSLTTNAKDIQALVEKSLPNYDVANYNESNIDSAKKDKAMLNKASKTLNDKRLELEKEFNKPFNEFKEIITETCKLIKTASDKIDVVVKESEQKEKDSKRQSIDKIWNSVGSILFPLSKIWDDKWLNKTAKLKDIEREIISKIDKVNDDILTIEAIGTDIDLLKSLYLDTLNLNSTIQYANTLKANRETAQKEAEERAQASTPVKEVAIMEVVADENPFEEIKTEPSTEPSTEPPVVHVVGNGPKLLVRTMKVITTYEKMVALGNFMNDNGITFEKLENE